MSCNAHVNVKFQFLYGAIEGIKTLLDKTNEDRFQFLYGAIEGNDITQPIKLLLYFNSFMVRLRVTRRSQQLMIPAFQFLYGAIEGR